MKTQLDDSVPNSTCFNVNISTGYSNIDNIIASIESTVNTFRRESSPTLCCNINSQNVVCIVDEGSVINCCSFSFAKRARLPIEPVTCAALGANKSPMSVAGITKYDIYASVIGADNLA